MRDEAMPTAAQKHTVAHLEMSVLFGFEYGEAARWTTGQVGHGLVGPQGCS